jgi:arginine/lysine/ornithine decarboxylase
MSNNIHTNSLIPNKRKRHKNIKAINTTASPSLLFLASIDVVCKHLQSKTRENVLL